MTSWSMTSSLFFHMREQHKHSDMYEARVIPRRKAKFLVMNSSSSNLRLDKMDDYSLPFLLSKDGSWAP